MIDHVALSRDDGEDFVVATLAGEIDFANVAEIGAAIAEAVPREAIGLIVDLAAVTFIDSAGVAIDDSAPVRRLLKITNIQEVVTLAGTVDECAAAMREASA